MTPIKIYGLPKTGTTYLFNQLNDNTGWSVIGPTSDRYGCKHGSPQRGGAVYIFLFRNVYEWAKSLLAADSETLDMFRGLNKSWGKHNQFWQNPIAYRNERYYSYLGFAKLHKSILLRYEHLRENPGCLNEVLHINLSSGIKSHAYRQSDGPDNPNRQPLNHSKVKIIDRHADPGLESFVNKLKVQY